MICFKRYALLLLVLLCLLPCIGGCAKQDEEELVYYTVTFDSNGGSPVEEQRVLAGKKLTPVSAPMREGYLFDGWKTELGSFWSFENDYPSSDLSLRAVWIPATSVFAYEPIDDTTATVTAVRELRSELPVPQMLGGYTVVAIADGVFADTPSSKVQRISLPQTITSVGEEAFAGCENITISFDPRAKLTEIGASAFLDCNRLSAISLGEGLREIFADTFFGCTALKEISLPSSLRRIEDNAFAKCDTLITVMLFSHLTEIGDSAFKGCDSLRTVYYYGSEEQMTALKEHNTANQNDAFLRATVYFYSETQPTSDGNYWYMNENNRPKLW